MNEVAVTYLRDSRGRWLDGAWCQVPGEGEQARAEFAWRAKILGLHGHLFNPLFNPVDWATWQDRGYPRLEERCCFANALDFVSRLDPSLAYVEGWASFFTASDGSRAWLAHAWCVDTEGRVVDPTWRVEALDHALPIEEWRYLGAVLDTSFVADLASQLHPETESREWTFGVLGLEAKEEIEEHLSGHVGTAFPPTR